MTNGTDTMNNPAASAAGEHEILLYYKYTDIKDTAGFMAWQKALCAELGLKGRILIATEGINGTVEGTLENTAAYIKEMHAQDGSEGTFADFSTMSFKKSKGTGNSFPKMKVKVRSEVVSLALERSAETDVNPNEVTGVHLKPDELKKWYENGEDFVVIDMRNDYEFKVGHFKNSIDPGLENFRDLPKMMPKLDPIKEASKAGKKVLTVCTGGIRCEKASGYLVKKGFDNVYQLDGGMHTYMEKYPGEDFLGALYVFDGREKIEFATERGLPREIVGKCDVCQGTTETYTNCANDECHKKILCCESCQASAKAETHAATGSDADISVTGSFVFCSPKCRAHVPTGLAKVHEMAF